MLCRELHHSLALKNLVIDAFIPQEEVQKVWHAGRGPVGCTAIGSESQREGQRQATGGDHSLSLAAYADHAEGQV